MPEITLTARSFKSLPQSSWRYNSALPGPTDTPSATSSLILESEVSSQPQATITVSEVEPVDPEFTFQDIPVWQLGLFGGGLVVAIGVLIVLAVLKKRRNDDPDEDDDDY